MKASSAPSLRLFICSMLLAACLLPAFSPAAYGQEPIAITTLPGLQFDKVQVAVKPGARITLTFTNQDDMSHNLVITKPGKRTAVVEAAMALAEKGPEMQYIPRSDDVLWHVPVTSPGEKKSITFNAPTLTGAYPFVCTYPGHGFVMYGVIHVSADLSMPPAAKDPDVPESRKSSEQAHTHHQQAPQHPFEQTPPFLYRAFMEESGLASIAVRLPGELAFCWDAEACKLRYAWSGEFLDMKDFWHGHKNAYAKVLGTIFYRDKATHPLRLGNREVEPTVKFKGYRLVRQYPEFHYQVNGTDVYELIREKPDGSGLERSIRIPDGIEPVWFISGENDGVNYKFSAGTKEPDGSLKLSPTQAKEFTITMTR
ncbi:hypothetical protein GCM10023091_24510 [Ravibacter arvi]|uniref:Blue (type 1) copper domain-containing protein n=1 Tax=Ravibacter arvi TaxID=2051041 RepID=A0ABP8LYS5_9BACT